jgi:hypothetical protein
MTKIYIALVDDWELKGNGLGEVKDLQYIPALKLMDLYEKLGVKATFMVEAFQRIAFEKFKDNYKEIDLQCKYWDLTFEQFTKRDFDVQLHIHPQWLNSQYDGYFWKLDSRWNIADYSKVEIDNILNTCHEFLIDKLNYKITAFRGGSWGVVGKNSQYLFSKLEELGFLIDISIVSGLKYNGNNIKLDYSELDSPYEPYNFLYEDPRKVSNMKTGLLEIPTQSVNKIDINFNVYEKFKIRFNKIANLFSNNKLFESQISDLPDHISLDPFGFHSGKAFEEYTFDISLDYDLLVFKKMADVMIKRALQKSGNKFLVLENHSKSLQSINNFNKIENLIKYIQDVYGDKIQFVTLSQICKLI